MRILQAIIVEAHVDPKIQSAAERHDTQASLGFVNTSSDTSKGKDEVSMSIGCNKSDGWFHERYPRPKERQGTQEGGQHFPGGKATTWAHQQ